MKKSILRSTSLVAMLFALTVASPSISSAKELPVVKVAATKTTAKATAKTTSKPMTVTAKSVAPVADDKVVATVPCVIDNNYQVLFHGYANGAPILWKLDTGAFAPVINTSDAARLKLPNLGNINVIGVTGSSTAYSSVMNVEIGGVTFSNVQVVVDPSYTGPSLFGYSFFAMNNYDLLVSRKKDEITILK